MHNTFSNTINLARFKISNPVRIAFFEGIDFELMYIFLSFFLKRGINSLVIATLLSVWVDWQVFRCLSRELDNKISIDNLNRSISVYWLLVKLSRFIWEPLIDHIHLSLATDCIFCQCAKSWWFWWHKTKNRDAIEMFAQIFFVTSDQLFALYVISNSFIIDFFIPRQYFLFWE